MPLNRERRDGSRLRVTGIDAFHTTVLHERRHVQQIIDNNTLPFYSGVTGVSREAKESGWSWCHRGRLIRPHNSRYNHFDPGPNGQPGGGNDTNLDVDFDGLGKDPRAGGADFDNGMNLETQAQKEEKNAQDAFANEDWGYPGKNHKTIRYDD